jgi:hypothetical protein
MKNMKALTYATLAILSSLGCSAAGEHDDASATPIVDSDTSDSNATDGASGEELARLEFDDGNVVRFEALAGGMLVSELGPDLNPRRIVPGMGLNALETYKALAPGQAVPERLLAMHESMYAGASDVDVENVPATEPANDSDLEHEGDFQQAYPADQFMAQMCDFPLGGGSYKHQNRTDAHIDASLDVHLAYFAVGSDKGIITAKPCAGENTGGFFDGECGSTVAVQAGTNNSGFYESGPNQVCEGGSGFLECTLFGCVTVCFHPLVRFELNYGKVSTDVNFHECVQVVH